MLNEKVLLLLKKIPKGKVTTYAELAKAAGTSPRAVGAILRSNKHPEQYPCYKVVKTSGDVGGYCGIARSKKKIALLERDGIEVRDGKIYLRKYFHSFHRVGKS